MLQNILVVDHPAAAQTTKTILAGSLRQVLTASSGEETLELLRSGTRVDLVTVELRLPGGISGPALITRIRASYPGTAVMLMTKERNYRAASTVPVLFKPFTASALKTKVEQLLVDNSRVRESLATAFRWNSAETSELRAVRESVIESIQLSRRNRSERYCTRLRTQESPAATILLAEQDTELRDGIARFLTQCGFVVLSAADGVEAVEASREHKAAIDLLLTGVEMPQMDGNELANTISLERPETEIILMTSGEVVAARHTFRKPFELDDLLAEIVGVLVRK